MGEIKSTLDIIMEKTKGLTMSDEEKKEFKEREARGKVKGLVQKFLDGVLDLDKVRLEMAALAKDAPQMINALVAEETIDRIRPGENNDPVLNLREHIAEVDTGPVKGMLADSERELEKDKEVREKALRNDLRMKGISGSALVPNLQADSEWVSRLKSIEKEVKEKVKVYINPPS